MPTVPRITKTALATHANKSKTVFVWERLAACSWGIQLMPSGTQTAVLRYGHGDTEKRIKLDRIRDGYTIDQARAHAINLETRWQAGEDIGRAPDVKAASGATVADVVALYLESARFIKKAQSTKDTDEGRLNNHILPLVGHLVAAHLTLDDAEQMEADITNGKTEKDTKRGKQSRSIVKGGPGVALKCVLLLKAALTWAIDAKILKGPHPFAGLEPRSDNRRFVTYTSEELRSTLAALDDLENARAHERVILDVIRLIMFTGARKSEITGATWADWNAQTYRLTRVQHKTAKKTKSKPRVIKVPLEIVSLVERQQPDLSKRDPAALIFQTEKGNQVSTQKAINSIRKYDGVPVKVTPHGFRHTVATRMIAAGENIVKVMHVLGHSRIATTQQYINVESESLDDFAASARRILLEG